MRKGIVIMALMKTLVLHAEPPVQPGRVIPLPPAVPRSVPLPVKAGQIAPVLPVQIPNQLSPAGNPGPSGLPLSPNNRDWSQLKRAIPPSANALRAAQAGATSHRNSGVGPAFVPEKTVVLKWLDGKPKVVMTEDTKGKKYIVRPVDVGQNTADALYNDFQDLPFFSQYARFIAGGNVVVPEVTLQEGFKVGEYQMGRVVVQEAIPLTEPEGITPSDRSPAAVEDATDKLTDYIDTNQAQVAEHLAMRTLLGMIDMNGANLGYTEVGGKKVAVLYDIADALAYLDKRVDLGSLPTSGQGGISDNVHINQINPEMGGRVHLPDILKQTPAGLQNRIRELSQQSGESLLAQFNAQNGTQYQASDLIPGRQGVTYGKAFQNVVDAAKYLVTQMN